MKSGDFLSGKSPVKFDIHCDSKTLKITTEVIYAYLILIIESKIIQNRIRIVNCSFRTICHLFHSSHEKGGCRFVKSYQVKIVLFFVRDYSGQYKSAERSVSTVWVNEMIDFNLYLWPESRFNWLLAFSIKVCRM